MLTTATLILSGEGVEDKCAYIEGNPVFQRQVWSQVTISYLVLGLCSW